METTEVKSHSLIQNETPHCQKCGGNDIIYDFIIEEYQCMDCNNYWEFNMCPDCRYVACPVCGNNEILFAFIEKKYLCICEHDWE